MDSLRVLVTGAGAPGIMGTIYSLKHNYDDRKIKIIGTDINQNVVGKYLIDKFYQIPKPNDVNFIDTIMKICEKEKVDVILPQVTKELEIFAKNKKEFEKINTTIAISDFKELKIANDKFELIKIAKKIGIPTPKSYLVDRWDKLIKAGEKLGFPFVVKPPVSNGMRGFREVHKSLNKKTIFYNEKPNTTKITLDDLYSILGERFEPLMVSEYLPGIEYTIDVLSDEKEVYAVVPRKRIEIKNGITFVGELERNEELIKYSESLSKKLKLKFAHGFQFKLDSNGIPKLLECNPRVQGTMVLSTFAGVNIIYSSIKLAMNEKLPKFKIKWNTKIFRYWGAIGVNDMIVRI